MSFNLDDITDASPALPPRIVLTGEAKIGKTTFAASIPGVILLSIKGEQGSDDVRDEDGVPIKFARFPDPAKTFDDVLSAIKELATRDHKFKALAIDSISALEPLVWDAVCEDAKAPSIEKAYGGYGKGYTEALGKIRQLTQALDYLREKKGMVVVLIGHVKVKRHDDPTGESYDRYQIDLNDKAAALLARWADAVLFANRKLFIQETDNGKQRAKDPSKKRWLFTQSNPAYPAGGRGVYGRLPAEIELNWTAYMDAVRNTQTKGE